MASTKLTKTFSGATTSNKIGTQSLWVKKCSPSSAGWFALQTSGASGGGCGMIFETDGTMTVWFAYTGTWQGQLETNRLFRDPNAWYHIVLSYDTTQGTASDRLKLYVNGVQETSFSTATYPAQDTVHTFLEASRTQYIAGDSGGSTLDGCISHFHCIDGTAYDASAFGSTDATTGEWKINTSPSVTYGNNGFFILKDGNSLTDQSPNTNNWTLSSGTLTKTEDNPSNVFCTNNALWKQESTRYLTHTRGNTMMSGGASATWYQTPGTLAFNSGKFYWECKWNAGTNLTQNHSGVIDYEKTQESGLFRSKTGSVFFTNEDGGEVHIDGPATSADYGTLAQNDILGVAVDMDAATPTVKFYKNGSLHVSVNASSLAGKFVTPAHMIYQSGEFQVNYGNGAFGSTQLTGTTYQGNGNLGIFNYQPPSGYTALSTKGLNL